MKSRLLLLALFVVAAAPSLLQAQVLFVASMDGNQESPPVVSNGSGSVWAVLSADMKTLSYRVTYANLNSAFTAGHFHAAGTANGGVVRPFTFAGNTAVGTWTNLPDSIVVHLLKGEIYANIHSSTSSGGEIRGYLRAAQGVGYTVAMDGLQESPPTSSTGQGTGWVVLDSAGSLTYDVTVAGLSAALSAGHFHSLPSTNVVHGITFTDSSSSGVWSSIPDSIYKALTTGNLYVNVHTSNFPGGEIRGFVTGVESVPFVASMDGNQESPPVVSNGSGSVWAVLSADMKTLTYRVTYANLNSAFTAGHFHAAGTANGGVVRPFTFAGNTAVGTWTNLPDSIVVHLLKGEIYANIHSSTSSGGEIRGYLRAAQGVGYTVAMDGLQESPPTSSTGQGTGWVVLDSAGSLTYDVTVAGLSAALSAGHFHSLPSTNVVHGITFTDSSSSGVWSSIPDSIYKALTTGSLYVNVHTSNFPGGEIRGFVLLENVTVTGVTENPPVVPTRFTIGQNYPNPFNPTTRIRYQIASATSVTLKVYNILGQEVASLAQGAKSPGTYDIAFDARSLASGVYVYRLQTSGGLSPARKMVLLK